MTRHRGVSQAPSNGTCEIRDRTVSPASTSPLGAPPAVSASYGNTLSPGGQTPSYDTDDRDNGLTDAASTAVNYLRDATDQIVWRSATGTAAPSHPASSDESDN